jgi:hypothetical protein
MTEKKQTVLQCPSCGRINTLIKHGFRGKAGQIKRQQWMCKGEKCYHTTCTPLKVSIPKEISEDK